MILINKVKILFFVFFITFSCDDDSNPIVQTTTSACNLGFAENPNYQIGENHQLCVPESFIYHTSMLAAYYFVENIYFDGNLVSDNDWLASFNGNVCVGAVRWGDCPEEDDVCSVVASGALNNYADPNGNTDGYLQQGDIPSFKIYIASLQEYYDVSTFEEISDFFNHNTQVLSTPLVACSEGVPNIGGSCD